MTTQPPTNYYSNSIFWVETDRIVPNPFQPRKHFDEHALADLAESIRQYGVLQPLVVTRKEITKDDGGIGVVYELIAGERRLRASRIAQVVQVPVIIRAVEESDKMKLELAIIENLQREDLNPIDRALAFRELVDKFNLKHGEVATKVGKSREYVSNSIRLLALPEAMQTAVLGGQISEGHARTLLMLTDKKEEQDVLFKEVMAKKLTVRETERIARRIAIEKARKATLTPELMQMEKSLSETLGTRVHIEPKTDGGSGKLLIDYFNPEDLHAIIALLEQSKAEREMSAHMPVVPVVGVAAASAIVVDAADAFTASEAPYSDTLQTVDHLTESASVNDPLVMQNDAPENAPEETDEDLYVTFVV
jgi:ParB family transcriptional regulator, chromosome partitioning protein